MPIHLNTLTLATTAPIALIDITQEVRAACAETGVRDGLLTLMSRHTTACLNINESEAQLQKDMLTFLKRFVPRDGDYLHNIAPVDDRDNAHAHLLGLMMTASVSIPIIDGELALGTWQSIFFVELDGPREARGLLLQVMSPS